MYGKVMNASRQISRRFELRSMVYFRNIECRHWAVQMATLNCFDVGNETVMR